MSSKEIYELYIAKKIEANQYLVLSLLKNSEFEQLKDFLSLLPTELNIKVILNALESKGLIEIDYNNNKIRIKDTAFKENENIESGNYLDVKEIDQLRILFNRELAPFELERIKLWYHEYKFEEIKNAIYKSSLKNIFHLNYIEKILQTESVNKKSIENENNQKYAATKKAENQKQPGTSKVKRNFELF